MSEQPTFKYNDPYTGKEKTGRKLKTEQKGRGPRSLYMTLEMLLPNRGEWVTISYPIEDWSKTNG